MPAFTLQAFTRWRLHRLKWRTSNCSSLLIYRSREDERLSWPGWLTSSGRSTHIGWRWSVRQWRFADVLATVPRQHPADWGSWRSVESSSSGVWDRTLPDTHFGVFLRSQNRMLFLRYMPMLWIPQTVSCSIWDGGKEGIWTPCPKVVPPLNIACCAVVSALYGACYCLSFRIHGRYSNCLYIAVWLCC